MAIVLGVAVYTYDVNASQVNHLVNFPAENKKQWPTSLKFCDEVRLPSSGR